MRKYCNTLYFLGNFGMSILLTTLFGMKGFLFSIAILLILLPLLVLKCVLEFFIALGEKEPSHSHPKKNITDEKRS